mgnify:CR=1 FL=1
MSRIGRKIIEVPKGVEVKINGHHVSVKGPLGKLENEFHADVDIVMEGSHITVKRHTEDPFHRSLHGLTRALLNNMIVGVTKGFEKKLDVIGTGYKVALNGNKLTLNISYTHPVEFTAPAGIKFAVEAIAKDNRITVSGIDRQLVGQVASDIRDAQRPEPYKGKGIKYMTEKIMRKAGKRGK